ncbi:MAG: IS1634 family transposase [Tessaracoccus sp.]
MAGHMVLPEKRAARDRYTLNQQRNKAIGIIEDGNRPARPGRENQRHDLTFDEATYQRAEALVGLKGYVTNITATVMPAAEVISSYHDLWHVEQSFRMSKHDLAARPIYHRTRDAIEAHLTIVFAALAIARDLQARTGWSVRKLIQTLRPLRHVTIQINGQTIEAAPGIPTDVQEILKRAGH